LILVQEADTALPEDLSYIKTELKTDDPLSDPTAESLVISSIKTEWEDPPKETLDVEIDDTFTVNGAFNHTGKQRTDIAKVECSVLDPFWSHYRS
jgi:hypothetical protein